MSTILPSSTAPAPSVNAGRKAPTRTDEPDQGAPDSFGQVLARSQQPADEKPAVKAAAPARRPTGPEKTEPQDLVNPMAALLVPFENSTIAAALPGGSAPSNAKIAPRTDAALANALAATPLTAGAPEVATGPAPLAATALPVGSAPSNAKVAARTDAALANPLAAAPLADGTDQAPKVATDPAGLAALASLTAAGSSSARQTPAPAREAVIEDKAVTAPRAMAAQAGAAITSRPDLSRQGGEDAAADTAGDEQADLALLAADGVAGAGSAQWLQQPAGAALQATTGAAAPNPPAPVNAATVLLTPEVGSSEWSKALGQQVVHMGSAGNQVAELQLNPPGLGPLKVTLSMIDQQMQAVFVSAHSSVRAAVEAALPQLRTLLAESGISLGNTSVGSESQQQTAFSNSQNGQNSQQPREIYRTAATDAALFSARQVTQPVAKSSSLRIDTYA